MYLNRNLLSIVFSIVLILVLSNIVLAKDLGNADGSVSTGRQAFQREKHPCETDESRKSSTAKSGVLQYDIDCVPFHQNEILDLTGKSSYSIVGWIPRIITVVYRFMFTLSVIAFLIASFKYYKAAVTGKGGAGVGFQEAKTALGASLVGFLIASSAWVIVSMWTRGVSLIEV